MRKLFFKDLEEIDNLIFHDNLSFYLLNLYLGFIEKYNQIIIKEYYKIFQINTNSHIREMKNIYVSMVLH